MTAIERAIYHILTGNKNFCSFCFKTIEEAEWFHSTDEVLVNNQNIELFQIFAFILGDECLDNIVCAVCKQCTTAAMASYKFIKMCQDSTRQFKGVISSLHEYCESTTPVDGLQSLLLSLNIRDYRITQYSFPLNGKTTDNSYQNGKIQMETVNDDSDVVIKGSIVNSERKTEKKAKHHSSYDAFRICDIIHDNRSPIYKCKDCLKVFPQAWNLKQHYVRVHAPKKFQCNKCSRSYGSEIVLKLHDRQSHCAVVCSECGKIYQNTYSLKKHEMGHKVRLTCRMCGKVYKGKKSFDNHINNKLCLQKRKSNSEAKFTCNYCQKKYSQKTALSVHIQLEHENGTGYSCQWCGKRFGSQSKLKEHVVKHTKEKNFSCELCGGRYVTKASLLYHTRTHTGEKPYKCIQCDSSFLSASRRSDHMRRHHMAQSLQCDVCHRKFRERRCFLKHKKGHSNSKVQTT